VFGKNQNGGRYQQTLTINYIRIVNKFHIPPLAAETNKGRSIRSALFHKEENQKENEQQRFLLVR
jgi:hypothetical protein